MNTNQKFLFGIIIFLALFFRVFQIHLLPGGLFPDEAANGLDINLMQAGQLQPFYERGNGREALFFYMLWGSIELFGKGHWQHHLVSALGGVMSVIICFAVTKRLMLMDLKNSYDNKLISDPKVFRATNIALLSAFLMAVSTWHVVLSRTAFRANLIPLFAGLTFYFLLKTFQDNSKFQQKISAFLAGTVFALGFYTYIAYRILVPILIILIVWPWFSSGIFQNIKKWWKVFVVFLFAFAIFILPLTKYFYTHPGSFVGRSGQVSVFNPELNQGNLLGAVVEVTRLSLQAYFTQGDLNWRHNLSGFPFLSPLYSPFFGIALVVITFLATWYIISPKKRAGWWKYAMLAGWFWGMLLPVITTAEGIPHGLRAIGTIPVVFMLSGWALYTFGEWIFKLHEKLHEKWPRGKGLINRVLKFTILVYVVSLTLQTYFLYFVYAANSPENFYSFRSDLTVVSKYLKTRCDRENTYLILDKFSVQTVEYLTSDQEGNFEDKCHVPYIQVDPENAWELSGPQFADEVIFTQSSIFDIKKFIQYHPQAKLKVEVRNKFGQAVMAAYRVQD